MVARSIKYIIDIEDASKAEQGNSTLEIVSTRQVLWLQLLIIEPPPRGYSQLKAFVRSWRGGQGKSLRAFVPLTFALGEAVWNSVWSCDPSGRTRTKMKKRGAEQGATSTTHFEAVKRGAGQDHRPNGPSISQVVCAWQLGVGTKHIHNFKYDCGWLLRRGRYHANPRLNCATPTMKP